MPTEVFTVSWLRGLKAATKGKRIEWLDKAEKGLAVQVCQTASNRDPFRGEIGVQ